MTVASVAVVTVKLLFGMCDFAVDNNVGKDDFSLVLRILHMYGHMLMRFYVSPGMDWMKNYATASQTLV